MKKFSVLLSTYYKENPKYLDEALQSIVSQTLMPSEIVLMEDGKLTEELDSVINKYCSLYPKLFKIVKNKKNRGLGPSLRDGVKKCKYDIIARMDTDDIASPDRFEKQLKEFDNEDIVIVGSNVKEYDETMANVISVKAVPQYDDEIKKYMKKRNPFNHMSVAFRKQVVLNVNNYEDVPLFEDYYLWCKVLKQGKGYNVQECLVNVRGGDSMYKRRGGLSYIKCIINFQNKINKLGIINRRQKIINIITRICISIVPVGTRALFYKKILRRKENN